MYIKIKASAPDANFVTTALSIKGGVRIVLNLGGGSDINDASKTRVKHIKKIHPNDKLIYITDDNLGNLKDHIEKDIKAATKDGYGKTLEFTVFSHAGEVNGPVGGYYEDNKLDLSISTGDIFDRGQLGESDWSDINYNFDPENSVSTFYGCNSASWAEKFISLTNVKHSGGIAGKSGGSYNMSGEFEFTFLTFGRDVYMRAKDEDTNQILPLFYYTRDVYERNKYGSFLKEHETFKHWETKSK